MSYLLEAQGLRKAFGDFVAVDGVSFRLNAGEIVGFLGPNGAGKTTTIKLLTGLLAPDQGWATIGGSDLQREPLKAKARFAYVPDTPNLYGRLKTIEYLRFVGQLYRVPPAKADERAHRLLEVFGLTSKAGEFIDSLSHGTQQKVAIIGALLYQPEVLIMDEPTVGLDPRAARIVKELLVQHRDAGNVVFFSSHILEIVQNMCDRVIIIDRGKIQADAPVAELRAMRGERSLEAIFLELTGGKDVDALVGELSNAG